MQWAVQLVCEAVWLVERALPGAVRLAGRLVALQVSIERCQAPPEVEAAPPEVGAVAEAVSVPAE